MAKSFREALEKGTDYFSPERQEKLIDEKRKREKKKEDKKIKRRERLTAERLNLAKHSLPKNSKKEVILLIIWLKKYNNLPSNYQTGCCFCGRNFPDALLIKLYKKNLQELGITNEKYLYHLEDLLQILWHKFSDVVNANPPRICKDCLDRLKRTYIT